MYCQCSPPSKLLFVTYTRQSVLQHVLVRTVIGIMCRVLVPTHHCLETEPLKTSFLRHVPQQILLVNYFQGVRQGSTCAPRTQMDGEENNRSRQPRKRMKRNHRSRQLQRECASALQGAGAEGQHRATPTRAAAPEAPSAARPQHHPHSHEAIHLSLIHI